MKQYSIFLFLGTALAVGQTTITTYQPDINGRQEVVALSSVAADGQKTQEQVQTVNGRKVSREQITERVISSDAKGKVIERLIRKLDPVGNLSGTERVLIEESFAAGGNKTVTETIYRSTVNGPMQEAQRSKSETRVSGDVTTTEVVVERPAINRSFVIAERRKTVTQGTAQNQQTTETVLRPDETGRLTVTQRKETSVTKQGGDSKVTTSLYEPHGSTGSDPVLISRSEETTTRKPDGTQTTEINLYLPAVGDSRPVLKERKTVELRTGADGSVTETTSVRLPVSENADRLGEARVISETVCVGKCAPEKSAETAAEKPATGQSRP